MDMMVLSALFDVLAPVLLIVLIGYWLRKSTSAIDTASTSRLIMLVGTPSLVFSTLTTTELPAMTLLNVSLGALVVCCFASAFAYGVLKLLGHSVRTYLPPLTMPNSGNLGLPLVLLAFGEDGLAKGVAFYFVVAIVQYVLMPVIVAGRFSAMSVIKEPLIWAVVAALVVKIFDAPVPQVIADTTGILGGMMIPVMLILLGAAIAQLAPRDIRTASKLALARLGIGTAAGLATIIVVGASGVEAGAIFLLASMPSAVVTYVIAARYDQDAQKVAGLVVMSTLLTLLCLPALLWIALEMAGI